MTNINHQSSSSSNILIFYDSWSQIDNLRNKLFYVETEENQWPQILIIFKIFGITKLMCKFQFFKHCSKVYDHIITLMKKQKKTYMVLLD